MNEHEIDTVLRLKEIERLREDLRQYKNAFEEKSKKEYENRCLAEYWKKQAEFVAARSMKVIEDLQKLYEKSFNDVVKAVKSGRSCKGCDAKALIETIKSFQPASVQPGKRQP